MFFKTLSQLCLLTFLTFLLGVGVFKVSQDNASKFMRILKIDRSIVLKLVKAEKDNLNLVKQVKALEHELRMAESSLRRIRLNHLELNKDKEEMVRREASEALKRMRFR